MKVFSDLEIWRIIFNCLKSKKWWFVLDSYICGDLISNTMSQIEFKFYTPGSNKNNFFQIVHFPNRGVIYMLEKSLMSKLSFADFVGMPLGSDDQDVICPRLDNSTFKLSDFELEFYHSVMSIQQAQENLTLIKDL